MRRIFGVLALSIVLTLCFVPTQIFSQTGGGPTQRGNPSTRVWVNTDSRVYHCPNTRWYGATTQGKYMIAVLRNKPELPSSRKQIAR